MLSFHFQPDSSRLKIRKILFTTTSIMLTYLLIEAPEEILKDGVLEDLNDLLEAWAEEGWVD